MVLNALFRVLTSHTHALCPTLFHGASFYFHHLQPPLSTSPCFPPPALAFDCCVASPTAFSPSVSASIIPCACVFKETVPDTTPLTFWYLPLCGPLPPFFPTCIPVFGYCPTSYSFIFACLFENLRKQCLPPFLPSSLCYHMVPFPPSLLLVC